ncbi:MAG: (p)ppGpp synthetase [Candidatus Altiarchaeales archaeon A3]|nr:MAG: (p)ppGpp synthetase [Candidatus Altiarchaeales archaeon A3]
MNQFLKRVFNYFSDRPKLNKSPLPIIHSIKHRIKDPEHLSDKIRREWSEKGPIDGSNLFEKITDLAGVRILHLHQAQFSDIHKEIIDQIEEKEWYFVKPPVAYTWDPESETFFKGLNIECQVKESFYTSTHYIVKPREKSNINCEIQVRTLYEEIWSEIDHFINYPNPINSIACKEQLKVLSKLTNTGTRLVDSIFKSYEEHLKQK